MFLRREVRFFECHGVSVEGVLAGNSLAGKTPAARLTELNNPLGSYT